MNTGRSFLGRAIRGRFAIVSGVWATQVAVVQWICDYAKQVGIIVLKSTSREPLSGYSLPVVGFAGKGSLANAVGLANPGAEETAWQLARLRVPEGVFILASIVGSTVEEFVAVATMLLPYVHGFELNISCPHGGRMGQSVGQQYASVTEIVRAIKALGLPVVVKLSPNLDIAASVQAALAGGANAFAAINTVGPFTPLYAGQPILSHVTGGLSGEAILETGLQCVEKVRAETADAPMIVCGGIRKAEDARQYLRRAGEDSPIGIGTAFVNMDEETKLLYLAALDRDLEEGTNTAEQYLRGAENLEYGSFRITGNKQLSKEVFLLEMRYIGGHPIKTTPGQFVFARIPCSDKLPASGERPFSVFMDETPKQPLRLLIKQVGCVTKRLAKLQIGDTLWLRGPCGQSPTLGERPLGVFGGTGIAESCRFLEQFPKSVAVLGARELPELCPSLFRRFGPDRVHFRIGNEHCGKRRHMQDSVLRGDVLLGLETLLQEGKFTDLVACGPEKMLEAVLAVARKYLSDERIWFSLERTMKCGVGICGSCVDPVSINPAGVLSCTKPYRHPAQIGM